MPSLNSPCKTEGIRIARLIYAGDVDGARRLSECRKSTTWSVPEARAILAAAKHLGTRFGVRGGLRIGLEILGWDK